MSDASIPSLDNPLVEQVIGWVAKSGGPERHGLPPGPLHPHYVAVLERIAEYYLEAVQALERGDREDALRVLADSDSLISKDEG